ncbi:small ribosomal subunit protein mS40-like [Lineus longissimus]|uniref:small ribosomal subunit protein mS40-like n=1 Tax=Lineus longissimus TaxID=88925 RepID=UPI00315DA6F3
MRSAWPIFSLLKKQISIQSNTFRVNKLALNYAQDAARTFSVTTSLRQDEESEEMAAEKPKRLVVDPPTSIRYLKSKAYRTTYGDDPVWKHYRRNFKAGIPPEKTRKTCIRAGEVSTGNPCPICRDEYLVIDFKNRDLLKQFINPYTGEVLSWDVTGICQKQHKNLLVAVEQAQDYGLINVPLPHRHYDYSEYYRKKESS